MSQYHRAISPGGTFFFTLVTHQRKNIFENEYNVQILRDAIKKIKATRPFNIDAMVVLPDHIHCIWKLPEDDFDFSGRWREIKKSVTKSISHHNGYPVKTIWQRRFWEHLITDDKDWRTHMDYIHYNPVKHGYVKSPIDWPWSSFNNAVKKGWYDANWGSSEPEDISKMCLE